jgi:histidine kinase
VNRAAGEATSWPALSNPLLSWPGLHVYRANSDAAATVLLKVRGPSADDATLLEREARLLASLDCTQIPRLLGRGSVGSERALILEDIGGAPLSVRLGDADWDLRSAVTIAADIATALECMERASLMHGALTPHCIVATRERAQLLDLGLAVHNDRSQLTGPEDLHYAAPEQTGRLGHAVDARSDLYALGVLLHELLTGATPFSRLSGIELVHAHLALIPDLARGARLRDGSPLPRELAEIMLHLLAKDPNQRYQSAAGARADLWLWLERQSSHEPHSVFKVGRYDRPTRLRASTRLVGREAERIALMQTLDTVQRGGRGLTLLAGASGMGKTALVRELLEPIVATQLFFLSGKFDQARRDAPYAAVVQALEQLCRKILAEDEAELRRWRLQLSQWLGEGARTLTWLLPDLAPVLDAKPAANAAPAGDLSKLLIRMLEAVAQAGGALVLFLDDVQWADEASCVLLRELAKLPGVANLHVIASYRSGELSAEHPLLELARQWREAGVHVSELSLLPLDAAQVNELVAHALARPPEESKTLSAIVHEASGGSPLYVTELLQALTARRLIQHEIASARWVWDAEAIRRERSAQNVLELIPARLLELPAEVLQALQCAACLGNRVTLELLVVATAQVEPHLLARLQHAAQQGLIRIESQPAAVSGMQVQRQISFVHDSMQQAVACSVADPTLLAASIARRLTHGRTPHSEHPWLFVTVAQLNAGQAHFSDAAERVELARWNAAAAGRARDTGAPLLSLTLAETGIALLGLQPFETDYALAVELHSTACEGAAALANLQRLDALAQLVGGAVRQAADASRVVCAQVRALIAHGSPARAVALGTERLRELGICLDTPSDAAFIPIDLETLPEMSDAAALAAARLLSHMGSGAYVGDRASFPAIAVTLTRLMREHGTCAEAGTGLAWTSTLLLAQRRYVEAYSWGQSAVRLMQRYQVNGLVCQTLFVAAISGEVARDHTRRHAERFRELLRIAAESGNFEYVSWIVLIGLQFAIVGGQPLSPLLAELPELLQYTKAAPIVAAVSSIWAQLAECLATNKAELEGSYLDWRRAQARFEAEHALLGLSMLASARMMLAVYMRQYREAGAIADETEAWREGELGIGGFLVRCFYAAASVVFSIDAGEAHAQSERMARARRDLNELRAWAETAPHNTLHKIALLEAELARIRGDSAEALRLYDSALRLARQSQHEHEAALAHERAAALLATMGCTALAGQLQRESLSLYQAWGLEQPTAGAPHALTHGAHLPKGGRFDEETVAKAARIMSGVVDRKELVCTLVGLALENAGAQLGCYASAGQAWSIEAHGRADGDHITTHAGPDFERVCFRALNYVGRTGRTLILDCAGVSELSTDAYIQEHNVRSLLCLPIRDAAGAISGALYLENNLVDGAFTEQRVQVLTLLMAQLAVSLENAALYGQLTQTVAALEQTNAQLEDFVNVTSHDLREPLRTIASYAQLLQRSSDNQSPRSQGFITWIVRGAARMANLLDDIRDYTRCTRNDEDSVELALDTVAQTVCDHLARSIDERSAQITWHELPSVTGRPGDFQLLLLNLLGNAMKFSKQSSPRVEISAEASEHEYVIRVDDNGIGVPEEFRQRIFERFQRLHSRGEFEGSGLGLSTCQRIVQRFGGRIWCELSPLGGARFCFSVPRTLRRAQTRASHTSPEGSNSESAA